MKHPLQNEKTRRIYHKAYIKSADTEEAYFRKILKRFWKEQEKRVKEAFTSEKSIRNKGLNNFFDLELEIKLCKETFIPVITDILERAGKASLMGDKFEITGNIASWLDNKAEIFAKRINETTFEELKTQLNIGVNEGETLSQLADRVEQTYKDIERARALTITRTETQGSMQKGKFEAYNQYGMNIKIWVAVMDANTRDSHAYLDGMEVPINMPFENGLQYPGDPSGPAEEIINCRCTI